MQFPIACLGVAAVSTLTAAPLWGAAQDPSPRVSPPTPATQEAPPPCDTNAIRWVLPADFDVALRRARAESRLLLIKGVSFGIDAEGAKCATKGRW